MTTTSTYMMPAHSVAPGIATLQRALIFLIGAGGAVVFIEPSPFELATLGAMIVFFATGLRMQPLFVPLLLLLFLINIGYTICAAHLMDRTEIVNWVLTSWYMSIVVLFFAMVSSEDTLRRLELLRRGLILGALIAATAGLIGYFQLFPGAKTLFTLYSRASGTFKDPNVFGAFLILPSLFLLQSVLADRFGKAMRSGILLSVITLAIMLSFSRAAWGQLVGTAGFMVLLMYITSTSSAQRSRIVIVSIVAIALAAFAVTVLLSLDSVGNLFKERASLGQSYDSGRFGRFGRHILGAEMALELPLGIGPLQFTRYFPEDTHNSYLNAFMSGGWISGLAYPALIFMTIVMGFRHAFVRTPWQRLYIAIFAAFLGTVCESLIIDTDHWRHFWLMLGAMWGMFAAARAAGATGPPGLSASRLQPA